MNEIFLLHKSQLYAEAVMHWMNRQHTIGALYNSELVTCLLDIEWIRIIKEEQIGKKQGLQWLT